ncbi:MAG: phosphotriesterase family protein [Solimonas sp.]
MRAAAMLLTLGIGLSAQRGGVPPIPNLAGKVLTVRGPIDPATLGSTLMHEHIFIDFKAPERVGSWVPLPRPPQPPQGEAGQAGQVGQGRQGTGQPGRGMGRGTPGWNLLDNYDESLAEVMEFKKAGGGTIVDVTNFGLSRNPEWLERISEASGLHVVMGAGWYQKALHPPDMSDRTVEELTDIIVRDIVVGAQGTNIRSGIIGEIGVQGRPMTENEIKSIRASARASRLTGAPMTFHMGGGTPEEKQQTLDIVASEGVDLNHVVMGHNGSGDVAVMKRITDRGAYIEFDYIGGAPQTPDDGAGLRQAAERRAQQIKNLIDGGLTDRILVAHDVCTQPQLKKNGGGGFAFTSNLVIPALKALGVSDAAIHTIMVENPRRVLTFVAPQRLVAQE